MTPMTTTQAPLLDPGDDWNPITNPQPERRAAITIPTVCPGCGGDHRTIWDAKQGALGRPTIAQTEFDLALRASTQED